MFPPTPQEASGVQVAPGQLIILLIVGASVDFVGARGTRLKNATLEKMWRLRRRKLKLKKPLRLKRRKKLKAAKKKKNEGANKAAVDLPGASGTATVPDTSSSSEERSPFLETGTRSKRVNFLGAAKKASVFRYPSLGKIHEAVEEMPVESVREQVLKACTAKTSESYPVMKGIIHKYKKEH